MKTQKFQMRISAETREQLNTLKQMYQMSASAVICMLISKEVMKFKREGNRNYIIETMDRLRRKH